MGFLDRVVADMVSKSTGFNTRGLVRLVGGKRMLAIGGAALAGALLQEKMKGTILPSGNPQTGSAPAAPKLPRTSAEMSNVTSAAPPALPPLPSLTKIPSPGETTSELPPPPSLAEAVSPDEVTELPPELLYAVLRTMVAAALSDGAMHEREREAITSRLAESGLSDRQIARIHQDLLAPAQPIELAAMVDEPEDRELLLRFAILIALSDDEVGEREKTWLGQLAVALEIDSPRVAEIENDIYG